MRQMESKQWILDLNLTILAITLNVNDPNLLLKIRDCDIEWKQDSSSNERRALNIKIQVA